MLEVETSRGLLHFRHQEDMWWGRSLMALISTQDNNPSKMVKLEGVLIMEDLDTEATGMDQSPSR